MWLSLISLTFANDSLCQGVDYDRFVRDPSSCARYFLCRNDRAFPGSCEDDLLFDYDSQMCRYSTEVNCGHTTTTEPSVTPEGPIEQWVCIGRAHNSFCADPRRCGSYFFCQNQIGRPGNCPRRFWFHPLFHFCTNPGGFCAPRDRCDNGIDVNGRNCEDDLDTTTVSIPTTTESSTTPSTTPTTETPSGPIELWICIGVANNAFRGHPQRCGSFFVCRNNVGTLGNCPRRFWFNSFSNICTNPLLAFCTPTESCDNGSDANGRNCEEDLLTTTVSTPTTTVLSSTTPSTTPTTTEAPSGPIELWICIGQINYSFRRHPHRCGSFFVCRNNVGTLGNCPRRFWFNQQSNVCTNPLLASCTPTETCDNGSDASGRNCEEDLSSTTVTTPITTTVITPTTSGPTTTEIATTETPSGPIELWICIGQVNYSFRRHPNRCGSFFLCRNNIGTLGHCPRRFWFSSVLNICTNPLLALCTPTEVTCDNGSDASGRNCEEDLLTTTVTTPATTTVAPATTPSGPIELWICIGRPSHSFRAHPTRCGSFFLCVSHVGFMGSCPRGFWFHPSHNACTSPGNFCVTQETCDNGVGSECANNSESSESHSNETKESIESNSNESTSKESNSFECDSDESKSSESNKSDSSDSSDSKSDSRSRNDSRCKDNGGGITGVCAGKSDLDVTANPLRCGSFYLCMMQVGLPVECPHGQWFNPNSRICTTPGSFCTSTLPCDNGHGSGCTNVTTEDPIITPTHSTTLSI